MRKLLGDIELKKINREKIIYEIKFISNIGHKFSESIYDQIIKYIYDDFDYEFLFNLVQQEYFEPVIVLMIKVNCLNQIYSTCNLCNIPEVVDVYVKIINNLTFFPEFLDDKMRKFVETIRYNLMKYRENLKLSDFINFKALLLSELEIKLEDLSEDKMSYWLREDMGKYALIRLSDENKNWLEMENIILTAFCKSNLSVEEYVENLSDTCSRFYVDLSYMQEEKMKYYLLNLM